MRQRINRWKQWETKKILAAILAVAVLLRLGAAFFFGNQVEILPGTYDQVSYHNLALRLLDGHGFTFGEPWWPLTAADAPTAHWSYLYTFYLAGVYALFGPHPLAARLIQALLVGLLQTYLAFALGRRLYNERVGLWAAALTAGYLYFIYYAATLMTEPFYITAVLASLYGTIWLAETRPNEATRPALFLAVVLAVAVHLRQLFLLLIPFLLLWLAWRWYERQRKLPLLETALIIGLIAGSILPFTYYNYQRFDRIVALNTNAGFAFFWGNHPVYGTRFHPILPPELGNYLELIPEEVRGLDEAALERALLERGIQFVVDDPVRYLRLSLSRIPSYFTFWPTADSSLVSNLSRLASFGLALPFMLYGLWLALAGQPLRRRLRQPFSLLLLFALLYTAVHVLSWTLIRYRLPVDAALLVFAALALERMMDDRRWTMDDGR